LSFSPEPPVLPRWTADNTLYLGELSLSGELRAIRGALPLVLAAREMGFRNIVIPEGNAAEVAIISAKGINIYPLRKMTDLWQEEVRPLTPKVIRNKKRGGSETARGVDLSDICGQVVAKKCLEISAAGGHNLLMIGPPGAGKSMLSQALGSILPDLTEEEMIEITKIYSICGLNQGGLITKRPFRSPHHSISAVGLLGGGSNLRPGEISLAHRGVLFLDEFPEFARHVVEAMRQPLEAGEINIARAAGQVTFPAQFTLVAAANPCPCGYADSKDEQHQCVCSRAARENYLNKLSGPMMDRFDQNLQVSAVEFADLARGRGEGKGETSVIVRERVKKARRRQQERLANTPYRVNAQIVSADLAALCPMSKEAHEMLLKAASQFSLSARSFFKIHRVAQTIADLEEEKIIGFPQVAQALHYRRD
ncbi:YifB family Mg chelatase-like AAA ATPase, partial [Microgenomates group bacterium]|nr:YifB family Mg chelatase-like AAA ATPase [Microgenomates group bacterium]